MRTTFIREVATSMGIECADLQKDDMETRLIGNVFTVEDVVNPKRSLYIALCDLG